MSKRDKRSTPKAWIIVPQTPETRRAGEGSAVLLKNGNILFVYSHFMGGGKDHDKADLRGGILNLAGGEIRDGRTFFPAPDALNQMSVSLERLQNGDIGMLFIRKTAETADDVFFSVSKNEGETWAEPVKINASLGDRYFVVNSDRLRQFSSGRLAVPISIYSNGDFNAGSDLAMSYSDDGGATWMLSERVRILDKNLAAPHARHPDSDELWREAASHPGKQQEPGVEELPDGRILLYCRTTVGYMYQAFSNDDGRHWSELKAATDIVSPTSPQSIRRIPKTDRLLCVFNDRRDVKWGDIENHWNWRTPLSIAISDDNAATWKVLKNIEDDSSNYCYESMLFIDDKLLLTYYESENTVKDGKESRRNLASLKARLLSARDFSPTSK